MRSAFSRLAMVGAELAVAMRMNRITVVSNDDSINAQARAYAEYRVFAVLAPHTQRFGRARVVLRHVDERGTSDEVTCAVTVALEPSGSLRTQATGPHVYAAINRAVERLGEALARRVERRRSSLKDQSADR